MILLNVKGENYMFEEKVGIIMGGMLGIGLVIVELFVKEGMYVVIVFRNSEKGEEVFFRLRKWFFWFIFIKIDVMNS